VRRIEHLSKHGAQPSAPLATVSQNLCLLPGKAITTLLRQCAVAYTAATNNPTPPIQLKALSATGATALLGRDVQSTEIKLIGRWKSDAMLRYLHLQSHDTMSHYANIMLRRH
jgi:hypothetical protein